MFKVWKPLSHDTRALPRVKNFPHRIDSPNAGAAQQLAGRPVRNDGAKRRRDGQPCEALSVPRQATVQVARRRIYRP